jgi:1,4-alpha-glucan branching enzyme
VPTKFTWKDWLEVDVTCFLVGDFSSWTPIEMDRDDKMNFVITIPLDTGKQYAYHFVLNGKKEVDKTKPTGLGGPHGELCNRVTV